MFIHVPYHWSAPAKFAEGFADIILNVSQPPANPSDVEALKSVIATRNDLEAEYITLFAWTVLEQKTQ